MEQFYIGKKDYQIHFNLNGLTAMIICYEGRPLYRLVFEGTIAAAVWRFQRIFLYGEVKIMKTFFNPKGLWYPEYELERLEYLRSQILAECISYGELAELANLTEFIDPSDVLLLEWAGIPEFEEKEGQLNVDYFRYYATNSSGFNRLHEETLRKGSKKSWNSTN